MLAVLLDLVSNVLSKALVTKIEIPISKRARRLQSQCFHIYEYTRSYPRMKHAVHGELFRIYIKRCASCGKSSSREFAVGIVKTVTACEETV